jgi:cob(I)alamin adenosyltransferase
MRITTKDGDSGLTSLLYGGRVRKDNLRVEACGMLDELSSFLGLSKSLSKKKAVKKLINRAQKDLFIIGSETACRPHSVRKLKNRIKQENIKNLESFIETLEENKPGRHSFVLPGKSRLSATFDVARTIARRTERRMVTLNRKRMIKNKYILIYLNRLSDLLYLLARSCDRRRTKK